MNQIQIPPVTVLLDRLSVIEALSRESTESQQFKYRGTMQPLPIVRVHISLPVYRTANHRTKTLQEEYLAKHPDLPKSFFQEDADSAIVQDAQREILETLIDQQDLLDSFRKATVEQEEPLLCTRDGKVVNGNRRLCAWRKLFSEDSVQYRKFESIQIMLLPSDCTEDDENEIERELQIKKTHRAEYSWHTKAAMIKEMFDRGARNKIQIAELFDSKPSEIDRAIACFEKAREYLYSIGHSGEWSLVDKEEWAFRKIVEGEKTIRDQGLKDVFSACVAALLQVAPEDIGGRKYEIIPKLAENISSVAEVAQKEILPEGTTASTPMALVMKTAKECRKPENLQKTAELVRTVLEAAEEKEDDREKSLCLLRDLTDISTRLVSAKNRDLDDRQQDLHAAMKQIEAILENAEFVKQWIERHGTQG